MIKAQVITTWTTVGVGTLVPDIPLQPGDSAMDVTGQQRPPPEPNAVIWEVWDRGGGTVDLLDPDAVLWSEEVDP
jgi:hypothetical protein